MTFSPARRLRDLLAEDRLITMPCCFDALSARLIEDSGFPLTFMSGFAVRCVWEALGLDNLPSPLSYRHRGRTYMSEVEADRAKPRACNRNPQLGI